MPVNHKAATQSSSVKKRADEKKVAKKRRKGKGKIAPPPIEAKPIPLLESDDLRKALEDDGVGTTIAHVGQKIEESESKYRDGLYRELARLYEIAQALQHDDDLWSEFCEDEGWSNYSKRPDPADRTEVLPHVTRFAVGATNKEAQTKASKYHACLQRPFHEGVPAAKIPALIKEAGGIEKMARQRARTSANDKANASTVVIRLPRDEQTNRVLASDIGSTVRITLIVDNKDASGTLDATVQKVKFMPSAPKKSAQH